MLGRIVAPSGSKDSVRARLGRLKIEIVALYLARRDPRVPMRARILTVLIVGYLLSPIDLIPDFIPVLGYVDDFILVPAGLALAKRMIPKEVLDEYRLKARDEGISGRTKWIGVILIVAIWVISIYVILGLVFRIIPF